MVYRRRGFRNECRRCRVSLWALDILRDSNSVQSPKHFLRGDWQIPDAHAGSVVDGIGDRCGYGHEGLFAERLCAVGADRVGLFDEYCFDGWDIDQVGDLERVQVERQRRAGVRGLFLSGISSISA